MSTVSIKATFGNHTNVHTRPEAILGDGPIAITIIMSSPGSYRFPGKIDKTMQQLVNLFTPEWFKTNSIQILNLINLLDIADLKEPLSADVLSPAGSIETIAKGAHVWKAWGNLEAKDEAFRIAADIVDIRLKLTPNKTVFSTPNPYACQYKGKTAEDIKAVLKSLFSV